MTEPVAWTNEAQLGFLKDKRYSAAPMAMWSTPHNTHDVPLYRATPDRAAIIEECAAIAERNGWEATAAQIRDLAVTSPDGQKS
jgi:hypothetical protein